MADETLRIRVDVSTATLGELKTALKAVNQEMSQASREEIPNLRAESQTISGEIKNLTGKTESLTSITKESRQEARLFRFAILELGHAFSGLGDIFGAVTNATADTKAAIKDFTATTQEAVGAGLGASFALKAFGGELASLAGPIGLAVGGTTALFGAIEKMNEGFKKSQEETEKEAEAISKLNVHVAELEHSLGIISDKEYLKKLSENVDELAAKAGDTHKLVSDIDLLSSVIQGLSTGIFAPVVKVVEVQKTHLELLKEQADVLEAQKKDRDEDVRQQKEAAKAEEESLERINEGMEEQLALAHAIELSVKEVGAIQTRAPLHLINVPELIKAVQFTKQLNDEIEELTRKTIYFTQPLFDAFHNLGDAINTWVIDKLGLATSVFQKFVADVISGILKIAEELASLAIVKGIFSLFGFGALGSLLPLPFATGGTINEPVFGIGKSGRAYTFGENGPERIQPVSRDYSSLYGGSGSMQPVVVRIEGNFRADGASLVSAIRRAIVFDKRGGGAPL